jgi:hypothetical protein
MSEAEHDPGPPTPLDHELLARAELALTQLNSQHGLAPDQSATLTAIRLRLEGKARASLDDLLDAGRDLGGKDPLADAMRRGQPRPSFEDLVGESEQRPRKSLDDLL